MKKEPLGIDGDGEEVLPLGEGWVLAGAGDYMDIGSKTPDLEVIFEVRDWSDLLENADDGKEVWESAVAENAYFAPLADEFPPFYSPGNYDWLDHFEVLHTETGGGMPGSTFDYSWIYVDEVQLDQVKEHFGRMAQVLKAAAIARGLHEE